MSVQKVDGMGIVVAIDFAIEVAGGSFLRWIYLRQDG